MSDKENLHEKAFWEKNFDYIGNSSKDIQIWRISNKAITFNARKSFKRKYELINFNTCHLIAKDKRG